MPRRFVRVLLGGLARRFLVCVASVVTSSAAGPPPLDSTPPAADRAKEFAPGVRINWRVGEIEVDAVVVLREGPLELLACSPHTKEHESIIAVKARPTHIFQALGLLGLQPGSPVRRDEKSDRWLAPTGQALELRVCYLEGGAQRTVPVERWLMDSKERRPPEALKWVFAGSRTLPDGRFGADSDGTVVCVVDFENALITLPAIHSADNDLLWLVANTEAIPPLGTACTLLIRAVAQTLEVQVAPDGSLTRTGGAVTVEDLAAESRYLIAEGRQSRIVLVPRKGVSPEKVDSVIEALLRAGIKRDAIEVPAGTSQTGNPPEPK